MDDLFFITGNENKFREASSILPQLKQFNLDLAEIQTLDQRELIEKKLKEANKFHPEKNFIVEDISLSINHLNGLPGPLIKWFLKTVGDRGIFELIKDYEKSALASCYVGLSIKGENYFFNSVQKGMIVEPRGSNGFGWDSIFVPDGSDKTQAEMSLEEKSKYSTRSKTLHQLKAFLEDQA